MSGAEPGPDPTRTPGGAAGAQRGALLGEAVEHARAVCAREVARHRAETAALRREHAEFRRTAGTPRAARPRGREPG